MMQVDALPFVHSLAQSELASDRALFVRIYRDLVAELSRRRENAPESWTADLQACLARAQANERELYLTELAKTYLTSERRHSPRREAAAGESVEAVLGQGSL